MNGVVGEAMADENEKLDVTPEMIDAGIHAYDLWENSPGGYGVDMVTAIYLAMDLAKSGPKTEREITDHVMREFDRLGRTSPMFGKGAGSTP